jgi:aspartate racemase
MPLEAVRIIGVLGGMGPSATVDFLAKIVAATPATCDQEHLPVVLWSNLDEDRELTVPVALDLLDGGADLLLFGCTEIPLALHHEQARLPGLASRGDGPRMRGAGNGRRQSAVRPNGLG